VKKMLNPKALQAKEKIRSIMEEQGWKLRPEGSEEGSEDKAGSGQGDLIAKMFYEYTLWLLAEIKPFVDGKEGILK